MSWSAPSRYWRCAPVQALLWSLSAGTAPPTRHDACGRHRRVVAGRSKAPLWCLSRRPGTRRPASGRSAIDRVSFQPRRARRPRRPLVEYRFTRLYCIADARIACRRRSRGSISPCCRLQSSSDTAPWPPAPSSSPWTTSWCAPTVAHSPWHARARGVPARLWWGLVYSDTASLCCLTPPPPARPGLSAPHGRCMSPSSRTLGRSTWRAAIASASRRWQP